MIIVVDERKQRMSLLSAKDILRAADRIKPYVRRTPLEFSYWLSEVGKTKVYLKLGECFSDVYV